MEKSLSKIFKFGSRKDLTNVSCAGSQHEGGNESKSCTIRTLDDQEVLQASFTKEDKGQALLDFTFQSLRVSERDYFGLRYVDNDGQRNWLDATRSVSKQVKGIHPIVFCFRVKFYPATPSSLREGFTRHLIYLQLRRDLAHGRLYVTGDDAARLMALIVQSELGDFDQSEHIGNTYISHLKLAPNQTAKIEERVIQLHKLPPIKGMAPRKAEAAFLRQAAALDTYGIDPHPVKDHKGVQLYVGVNHSGIISFQGNRKAHHFKWSDIKKITYEGRMFIVHHFQGDKKHLFGFKCPTIGACHYLWRCAIEQRYFFTMNSASEIPIVTTGGGLFSRHKLRYSGRTQREIFRDTIRQRQSLASQNALSLFNTTMNDDLSPGHQDEDDEDTNMETRQEMIERIRRESSMTLQRNPSIDINGHAQYNINHLNRNSLPAHQTSVKNRMVKSSSGQSYNSTASAVRNVHNMHQEMDQTCAASEDGAALAGRPQSQISRSFSITSAPPAVRTQMGRSNTAPLPCESPERALYQDHVVPYANYSSISEPYSISTTHPYHTGIPQLDPFDEDLEIEMSRMNGNHASLQPVNGSGKNIKQPYRNQSNNHLLPTEFDLRPDVTPSGEDSLSRSGSRVENLLLEPNSYLIESQRLNTASPSRLLRPDHQNQRKSHSSLTNSSVITASDSDNSPHHSPACHAAHSSNGKPANGSAKSNGNVLSNSDESSLSSREIWLARCRAGVISSVLLGIFCAALCVLIFEYDMDWARSISDCPEMETIRQYIYEPTRNMLLGRSPDKSDAVKNDG